MSDSSFTPNFERALLDGTEEFNKLDQGGEQGDMQLIARGVNHDDIIILYKAMWKTYKDDLQTEDERRYGSALASIIEIALFAGMSLERHRHEEERRLLDGPLPNWPES